MHVSILLFNGCDLLDAGGPYEVFHTASRLAERDGETAPFTVDTVTADGQPVQAFGGLGLTPTAGPEVLEGSQVVIVPGAIDVDAALSDAGLLGLIEQSVNRDGTAVASVCTGAFLLGAVGALAGRAWTTHWEDVDLLADTIGDASGGRRGVRWVDEGDIVSSGGLSSGIAMALHIVATKASTQLAERTARQLDYAWTNESVVD